MEEENKVRKCFKYLKLKILQESDWNITAKRKYGYTLKLSLIHISSFDPGGHMVIACSGLPPPRQN